MAEKNSLEWYIQQATVKIEVGRKQGSGFFIANIPPYSYILTAYHCIGDGDNKIVAKSRYHGRLNLNAKICIRGPDIAVLQVIQPVNPSDYCLPLGRLPRNAKGNEVISVGYPVIDKAEEASVFKGYISNIKEREILLQGGVIKGKGQSGASIYHCATNRVVGIAREISKDGKEGERAVNVDVLFDHAHSHWSEFEEFNGKLAEEWDNRIKQNKKYTVPEDKIFNKRPRYPDITTKSDKSVDTQTGDIKSVLQSALHECADLKACEFAKALHEFVDEYEVGEVIKFLSKLEIPNLVKEGKESSKYPLEEKKATTTLENKNFIGEEILKENERKPITSDEVECRVLRIIHELSSQSRNGFAEKSDIFENLSLNDLDNELINQMIDKLRRNAEIEYKLPDKYKVTPKGIFRLR